MLNLFLHTAIKAGRAILEIYNSKAYSIETKADESPLTTADLRSNAIINEAVRDLGLPVLSEENKAVPYSGRKDWKEFILVDPLDGTKEFIKRNGEFTVNIALIRDGYPVMGVIYAPVLDVLYWGSEEHGSWKLEKASVKFNDKDPFKGAEKLPLNGTGNGSLRVVASKSHFSSETEDFVNSLETKGKDIELVSRGSSLKLCLVAEGQADIYPRLGPTMEWDTAAGHAIAKYAGCRVEKFENNKELEYNKEDLLNPWFIVKEAE